jgi:hypothetical protein
MDLTNNLTQMTSAIRSVEVFSTDPQGQNSVLLVGTMTGVFQMPNPGATSTWSLLGTGLPHTLAYDIHYDYTDQVLVAGTLGRGAWVLNNPFGQPQAPDVLRRKREPRGVNGVSHIVTPLTPPVAVPGRP